jgi:hypothetical protein
MANGSLVLTLSADSASRTNANASKLSAVQAARPPPHYNTAPVTGDRGESRPLDLHAYTALVSACQEQNVRIVLGVTPGRRLKREFHRATRFWATTG